MSTEFAKHVPVETLDMIGGRLCLDFANTANNLSGAMVECALQRYSDLPAWGLHVGLLDREGEARLQKRAAKKPSDAAAALARALQVREALWAVFQSGGSGAPEAVDVLNQALQGGVTARRAGAGERWVIEPGDDLAAWLIHPVSMSALELLSSDRLDRVKTCASEKCGWVFVDESPAGRRQWCSMATCGNRAKAQRFYRAKKRAAS